MEQPTDLSSFANSLTQAGQAMDIVDGVKTLSGFYVIASTDNGKPHAYARLQTHESSHLAQALANILISRPDVRRLMAHTLYFYKQRIGISIAPHEPEKR